MDETEKYYTIADAADALGKTRQTIYDWMKAGRFPNSITAGRVTFLKTEDVEQIKHEEADSHIDALERLGFTVEVS